MALLISHVGPVYPTAHRHTNEGIPDELTFAKQDALFLQGNVLQNWAQWPIAKNETTISASKPLLRRATLALMSKDQEQYNISKPWGHRQRNGKECHGTQSPNTTRHQKFPVFPPSVSFRGRLPGQRMYYYYSSK